MAGPAMEKRGTRELIDSLRQTGGMLSGMRSELELEGGTENEKQALPSLDELDAMKTDEPEPDWGGMMAGLDEPQQAQVQSQASSQSQALEYRAGLPTAQAVMGMAGVDGTKNSRFQRVFSALETYQAAMDEPYRISFNEKKLRDMNTIGGLIATPREYDAIVDLNMNLEQYYRCVGLLRDVILAAESAAAWSPGRFNRNSRAKKLIPPIAAMIPRAYATMEKLSGLREALVSYSMRADKLSFTLSEALTSPVTGFVSDTNAYTGLTGQPGQASDGVLSREQMLSLMKADAKKDKDDQDIRDVANQIRDSAQEESRMRRLSMLMPIFAQSPAARTPEQIAPIAQRYISRLRTLQTALDDVAETSAKNGHRGGTLRGKTIYHQLAKLLYEAASDRDGVIAALTPGGAAPRGSALEKLIGVGGRTLAQAAEQINEAFYSDTAELKDSENHPLSPLKAGDTDKAGKYLATGGAVSLSVLDFANGRVLRTPAGGEEREAYGKKLESEETQKGNINGIYDELAGKVSRFMGLNVVAQAKARSWKAENGEVIHGGSVMDFAKGKEGSKYTFALEGDTDETFLESRRKDTRIQLEQNGRLISDLLKMNAVDYLLFHSDRHSGNYLINMEAGGNESMVTGIDNDMIMGMSAGGGYEKDADVGSLAAVHGRALGTHATDLKYMKFIPADLRDAIQGADLEAYERMLEPYVPRTQRYAAIQRMKDLKEITADAEIIDLTTPEGTKAYLRDMFENHFFQTDALVGSGGNLFMGNGLFEELVTQRMTFMFSLSNVTSKLVEKFGVDADKVKKIYGVK